MKKTKKASKKLLLSREKVRSLDALKSAQLDDVGGGVSCTVSGQSGHSHVLGDI